MAKEEKQQETKLLKGQDLLRSIEAKDRKKELPEFAIGDTIEVGVEIQEGDKKRIQPFVGICIGRRGGGARETITVRRIVQGEGVERVFPLHAPTVKHIAVKRHGKARRAKLNYLRERSGRRAKLEERFDTEAEQAEGGKAKKSE